jgi:hypothetical protein
LSCSGVLVGLLALRGSRLAHRIVVPKLRVVLAAVVLEFGDPGESQFALRALVDRHDSSFAAGRPGAEAARRSPR